MKKIFTLIAMAAMAINANAQMGISPIKQPQSTWLDETVTIGKLQCAGRWTTIAATDGEDFH